MYTRRFCSVLQGIMGLCLFAARFASFLLLWLLAYWYGAGRMLRSLHMMTTTS